MSVWEDIKDKHADIKGKAKEMVQKHLDSIKQRRHEKEQAKNELDRKIENIRSIMNDPKYKDLQDLFKGIREESMKSLVYDGNNEARRDIMLFDKLANKPEEVFKYYSSLKIQNEKNIEG